MGSSMLLLADSPSACVTQECLWMNVIKLSSKDQGHIGAGMGTVVEYVLSKQRGLGPPQPTYTNKPSPHGNIRTLVFTDNKTNY